MVRYHVLFAIELATRRVHIAGISADPHGDWMHQIARNFIDAFDGFLLGKRYLIQDRDPLFTKAFRDTLKAGGVESVRLPARSPDLNCTQCTHGRPWAPRPGGTGEGVTAID
jgi:hypothetical protein